MQGQGARIEENIEGDAFSRPLFYEHISSGVIAGMKPGIIAAGEAAKKEIILLCGSPDENLKSLTEVVESRSALLEDIAP